MLRTATLSAARRCYTTAAAAAAAPVKPAVALLAKLRKEHEGIPLSLAKKALVATANDYDAAVAWLADQAAATGASKAAKVQGRIARDGLVGVADMPLGAAIVEVNSETDFVARGDVFKDLVHRTALTAYLVAGGAAPAGAIEPLSIPEVVQAPIADAATATAPSATPVTVAARVVECIGSLGENLTVRRAAVVATPDPTSFVAGAYVHGDKAARAAGLSRLGAIVSLSGKAMTPEHAKLAKQLAQVVVGFNPPTVRELAQAPFVAASSFFESDGVEEVTVAKVLAAAKADVRDFVRFEVGEGIEQPATPDFAEEVRKQLESAK
ncbi:Elongation factor Ts, mitochondrial [Blastocladiella emersonii ATCC 22665]|nr:Elongation factor Ts, mitochondrial [Blastocladiella emersonii ATCC 22665]